MGHWKKAEDVEKKATAMYGALQLNFPRKRKLRSGTGRCLECFPTIDKEAVDRRLAKTRHPVQ